MPPWARYFLSAAETILNKEQLLNDRSGVRTDTKLARRQASREFFAAKSRANQRKGAKGIAMDNGKSRND